MNKNEEKGLIRRQMYTPGLSILKREDGAESRTITGYAILFNRESAPLYEWDNEEDREVIAPGAVTKGLLDASDILMTMFHDRSVILARSKEGKGTLSYRVDEKGVAFQFEAPDTAEGDKALELVRRGDIDGCSFAFSTNYWDENYVAKKSEVRDGKIVTVHTVNVITGIYDFTLTPDPAYPDTSCEAQRELFRELREAARPTGAEAEENEERIKAQIREMRALASTK